MFDLFWICHDAQKLLVSAPKQAQETLSRMTDFNTNDFRLGNYPLSAQRCAFLRCKYFEAGNCARGSRCRQLATLEWNGEAILRLWSFNMQWILWTSSYVIDPLWEGLLTGKFASKLRGWIAAGPMNLRGISSLSIGLEDMVGIAMHSLYPEWALASDMV